MNDRTCSVLLAFVCERGRQRDRDRVRVLFWSKRVSLHRNFGTEPVAGTLHATATPRTPFPSLFIAVVSHSLGHGHGTQRKKNDIAMSTVNLDASNVCHIAFIFERARSARQPASQTSCVYVQLIFHQTLTSASQVCARLVAQIDATLCSTRVSSPFVFFAPFWSLGSFALLSFDDLNEMMITCLVWIT